MNFDELKQRVRSRSQVDVDPALAKYRAHAPNPSVDGFLLYLRDQQVIDTRLFTELHTLDAIETSSAIPNRDDLKTTRGTLLMEAIPDESSHKISIGTDGEATKIANEEAMASTKLPSAELADMGEGRGPSSPEGYQVLGELGKGAMGEVHLARDMVLRRKVALKSILPAMQQNKALYSRFLGEMQITAQLDHPFIVPVYGVESGPSGGVAYAMKLVQGRELADLLTETRELLTANKPLDATHSLEGRLEAFLKVCDALAFAHERGVVHRDLKPANIMIGRFNEVYVMDWGIARLMGKGHAHQDEGVEMYDAEGADVRQTNRTRIGSTIGTPFYMSPEQAAGRNDELDGRSDLYSLGLILQELITLTGAVGGTTLQEVLTNAKDARRIPPRPPAPGTVVPRELQAIIEKATRLLPTDRYPSVTEFAEDIRRYLRNEAVKAKPDTFTEGAARWVSNHRMKAIALLLSAMMLGATATIGVLLYNRSVVNQQHTRELRLAELQASSAMRAQDLDEVMQHHEAELTRMAGAAGLALDQPPAGEVTIHHADDFKAGSTKVSGLVESSIYGMPVSFDWPVVAIAPGTDREAAAAQLRSIQTLRTLAKSIMLESFDPAFHAMSDADRQRTLADTGVPIARISVTMASGLYVEYPGNAKVPPDHDARKDAIYKETSTRFDPLWGAPRAGRGDSMVMPCSAPLRDHEGQLVGVLMFEIDLGRAVAGSLDMGDRDYIESSLVTDTSGKVIAQRNRGDAPAEGETLDLPEVREAMGRGERGYLQTKRRGHEVLVTYQPLSTVDWYIVTIANLDTLKRNETPTSERGGSVTAAATTPKPAPKPPAPRPQPAAAATAEPVVEPSASASASAAPSSSAPALFGKLPTAQPTSAPAPTVAPTAPPNPFDPWKAYDKK